MYGKELILDIHNCNCDSGEFSRGNIKRFMKQLCLMINMERHDLCFWDYKGQPEEYAKAPPHLKGTSAVQFISTSNITIHTLDEMRRVYLNIFSCKSFKSSVVKEVALNFFGGEIVNATAITRV